MRRAPGGVGVVLLGLLSACGRPRVGARQFDVLAERAELERRAARRARGIPHLAAALDDESPLVRRQAARLLLEMGPPAKDALAAAMDNDDLLVRRTALKMAGRLRAAEALPYLAKGIRDPNPLVRHEAASQLVAIQPRTEAVVELLKAASEDDVESVRTIAQKALWPFYRKVTSIRDEGASDHDVKVAQAIRLPRDGWRFHLDPKRDGHEKRWYEPDFDDSTWKTIAIEQAWQKAGVKYIGVAWYRRWIDLPPRPKHVAVELRFDGVDECAWVWLNGRYVGQHDIGPSGWNQAFALDVTQELKWGERNHITVRAMNTAHAGGIWKPVFIEVLE